MVFVGKYISRYTSHMDADDSLGPTGLMLQTSDEITPWQLWLEKCG